MLMFDAPPAAVSPDDPMRLYFGGKLLVTYASGDTDEFSIASDGTFMMYGVRPSTLPEVRPRYPFVKGHWTYSASRFCIIPEFPKADDGQPLWAPKCMTLQARAVGDTWSGDYGGRTVTFRLVRY